MGNCRLVMFLILFLFSVDFFVLGPLLSHNFQIITIKVINECGEVFLNLFIFISLKT